MHKIQRFERIRQQLRCLNTYRLYSSQSRLFSTDNTDENEENRKQTETSVEGAGIDKPVSDNTIQDCAKVEDLTKLTLKDGNIAEAVSDTTIPDSTKTEDFPKSINEVIEKEVTFAHLLRYSPLMNLGDPKGKIVPGKIFNIVDQDLYIEFGWKFYCVCPKPRSNSHRYVRGATVKIKIQELEMATKFIGATQELTLLEADCILLGLLDSPDKVTHHETRKMEQNVYRKDLDTKETYHKM